MLNNEQITDITKRWVEKFVIGLNLCPFARHPFKNNKIRYVVFNGENLEELTEKLVHELRILLETTPSVIETTLLILPDCLHDFEEYLDFLDMAELILTKATLEGVIQIASFHPDYQFEDTDVTDVENYTNRSPFPMFHLLREDSVERAIEAFPEVGDIPERNIETMNQMGLTRVKELLDDITRTH